MGQSRSKSGLVQSLDRGLAILEVLARVGRPLGVNDVADRTGLEPSTAHRLLRTMKARDFVRQETARGSYSLGLRVFQVGSSVLYIAHVRRLARQFLHELTATAGETSNLAILDGRRAVYIEQEPGPQFVRTLMEVGRPLPLYCTAVGKAILSCLNSESLDRYFANTELRRLTPHTITDISALKDELDCARREGSAVNREEFEVGYSSVASPVLGADDNLHAAVSVAGPTSRFSDDYIRRIAPIVREVAQELSRALK